MWLYPVRMLLLSVGTFVALVACAVSYVCIAGLWAGETFQSAAQWIALVVLPIVLFFLATGLLLLARRLGRMERSREEAKAQVAAPQITCPHCHADTVVRGSAYKRRRFRFVHQGRCLTCGGRCWMEYATWKLLAQPEFGDPYETAADRVDMMRNRSMTSGQIVCVILGALIGFAASLYLAFRLRGLPKGMFAVIPGAMTLLAVVGTWWLGRRLFPPARRPGQRCVKCGYDLRACAEPRCPECGTPFDWGAVKIRMLPPTEPRLPPGGDEPQ